MMRLPLIRYLALMTVVLGLSACTDATQDLSRPVEPLGDFRLGHNIVVAPNLEKLLISKEATEEEWIEVMTAAVDKRFSRFSGSRYYHLGISVEQYALAIPAPLVPSKSGLGIRVTVWDDAAQAKLNDETHVVRVVQPLPEYARTREQQMEALAAEAALWIERWMREQMEEEGWFKSSPSAVPVVTGAVAPNASVAQPVTATN